MSYLTRYTGAMRIAATAVRAALSTKVRVTSRATSRPSTAASVRFWATACMAHPSFVRVMKSWSAPITAAANSTFISSSQGRTIVPRRSGTREKRGGKGSACAVQNCCSE